MNTVCDSGRIHFEGLGKRDVIAEFDGGKITSDAGGLLLREVEKQTDIIKRLSECFEDYRDEKKTEHTVEELLSQRIYGIALGYEDLNDHDILRNDPAMAVISGKNDPTGSDRKSERDKGKALAGKSTLNRLELTPENANNKSEYKKIVCDHEKTDNLLIDIFIESYPEPPKRIVSDADATDDPIHGNQEGKFFQGYYKCYCYLPLYIFCEGHLLCAGLRSSDIDASDGTTDELKRITERIRNVWPETEIVLRGDSGFCRNEIMSWCEMNDVNFIPGLAKNNRLKKLLAQEMTDAEAIYGETGEPARVYGDFYYKTLESRNECRRVIGKAEFTSGGENPRFVVTSFEENEIIKSDLYEKCYCARGDMENRIKEQQLFLFADRTGTSGLRSNQLRLYFSSFAYVLMHTLRCHGLKGTELENAQCDTIRLKLLKISAQIRVTVRKVWISLNEGYQFKELFNEIFQKLRPVSGMV